MDANRSKSSVFPTYFPYMPEAPGYALPKISPRLLEESPRPIPPKEHWISEKYGHTAAEYLASGNRDIREMVNILADSGISLEDMGHILDFGCGDGRMIRWLEQLAGNREIWGADIHASRIFWCKQNLTPPLRFILTTTVPHLPFEDRYFDFVYAGSVFTHIDDLADAWFMELRRVLCRGGKLFVTVHLKHDVALLNKKYADSELAKIIHSRPEYDELLGSDFDVCTLGRSSESYVFYDLEYLKRSLEPQFRVLSVTGPVRLYQNALLLERL